MVDFNSKTGQEIAQWLAQEEIIWLTTVDTHNRPQPRPVWFHWDGITLLIFSEPNTAKIRHIRHNPQVALNFNTNKKGGEVGVLLGEAQLASQPVEPQRIQAYLSKYAQGIQEIGLTPESMMQTFSTVILVTPQSLRGM